MADIKIRIPETIRPGETVEVKTLAIAPPLANPEAEFDASGLPIPHYVGLQAEFEGRPVLRCQFGPGVARNVMFSFAFKPDKPGRLTLRWQLREGGVEERVVPVILA